MNRIESCFADLKQQQKKALIPFITAGDPNIALTLELMQTLVASGADIIELGVPFSDPMADGPVIQKASERALANNISVFDIFDIVRQFRQGNQTTPIILMGYLNPIEVVGYDKFARLAKQAGVDGLLTVDMPPEESHDFIECMTQYNLAPIFLLAPTTTQARIQKICALAQGFIYYVSLKGVTGAGHIDMAEVGLKLTQIRAMTCLPVGVGFGIRDADSAKKVAQIADAVVVGSAIVKLVEVSLDQPNNIPMLMKQLLTEIRQAIDEE